MPENKLSLFQKFVSKLLNRSNHLKEDETWVSLNNIQKVIGSLQFFSLAIEPARLLSRSLQHLIKGASGRSTMIRLSDSALEELEFWKSADAWFWNGKSFRSRLDLDLEFPPIQFNQDASDNSWGGVFYHPNGEICVF